MVYRDLFAKGLQPHMIFNLDETGMCLVNKSGRFVVQRGIKDVRMRKGGERGENITVIAVVNATRNFTTYSYF